MNVNIGLGILNAMMLVANLIDGGQGWLFISAIVLTSFAMGWCLAFGIAQIMNRRYG